MTPGGASSGQKGSRYERELVNALGAAGYFAMRCPSSGSATTRSLPDVIAMHGTTTVRLSEAWFIEHKSGDATTLYGEGDEVDALIEAAKKANATPLLGARFTSNTSPTAHYLVPPELARQTDGGNYGLPQSDIEDRAAAIVTDDGDVAIDP